MNMKAYAKLVLRLIREFLFFLMHITVNIIDTVQMKYNLWVKRLRKSTVKGSDIAVIMEHVKKWKKRPGHLVMLTDTDYHCISDLARLIIWSLAARVPFFSFYDITGNLKQNEKKLYNEVKKLLPGLPGYIKWTNKPDLNGYIDKIPNRPESQIFGFNDGRQKNVQAFRQMGSAQNFKEVSVQELHTKLTLDYPFITINIFTTNDGRLKIAHCISQIAEERAQSMQDSKEMTVQELDARLTAIYPLIPNPEVVFYTGLTCRTYGLLPWHISITEFVRLSADHSIDVHGYLQAMYKYNECRQRFGR